MHDEYEETRLKDSIAFWREKVDLLLQEKKEGLHEQNHQHKLIRGYEQQIEELKSQLRTKEDFIECLEMEKKLISKRRSLGMTSNTLHDDH